MARDFYIAGESMVWVKGRDGSFLNPRAELGLAADQIRVTPRAYHHEVHTDDWGRQAPAEVLAMLADCLIQMRLVHLDHRVLRECLAETTALKQATLGTLGPCGTPLGGYEPVHSSGCHYVSLNIDSPVSELPWRFPTCYLYDQPVEWPLGNGRSEVITTWRAIPYALPALTAGGTLASGAIYWSGALYTRGRELLSSGAVLWTHTLDRSG